MHSLSPEYIAKLRFNAQQLAMLRTLGEQRGRQPLHIAQLPEVLNDVRRVTIADSIESSTRLNGVTVAGHRLKSLALEKVMPQNRAEQEIAGYRDALNLICDGGDRMPLSESIVLQLHATLHRYPCSTTHMLTSKKLKRHGKSRTLQLMPTVIGVSTKAGL